MRIVSTDYFEDQPAKKVYGMVFGEVILRIDVSKDLSPSFRTLYGDRSDSLESDLIKAREAAIEEMKMRAEDLGAHAIVGCRVDYQVLGENSGMVMVTVYGTAIGFY